MDTGAMNYKLCTQCQFITASTTASCTTCGSTSFDACTAPSDSGDEPAVVALRPHGRHVSPRKEFKKYTREQQKLALGTLSARALLG
jgi:hypothetical protein